MKVLAIGENARNFAGEIWQEAEIDYTSLLPGKKKDHDYDAVLSYMVLPTIPYRDVAHTLKAWVDVLRTGGELTIMCPSLEWAAVQVLSKDRSPVLLVHLFGEQEKGKQYHSSAFTMLDLRSLCSLAGIAVTHAATGEYTIDNHVCEMHTVRGIKK